MFAVLLFFSFAFAQTIGQQPTQEENCNVIDKVEIFFFWREGCPHCHAETEFLKKLEAEYGEKLKVNYLLAKDNTDLFYEMAKQHGAPTQWLPATFIPCCNWHIIGFDEKIGEEIAQRVKNKLLEPVCEDEDYFIVPVLGRVKKSDISLPIFTITLGLLDGFNPCAMFVLLILLSLLIHTKSRKRTAFVAGTFLFFSGLIYFLFMTVWLSVFLFFGFIDIVRILLSIFAVFIGILNVKDFFFFKKGVSLSIPESAKPKIFEKMRKVVQSKNLPIIIAGTIFLAFTVNLFEFLCTAGFPAIFTNVLSKQNLPTIAYYLYMALYIVFYMLDDTIMVAIAVVTLRSKRLSETGGRWLKLISGIAMLCLGLAILIAPNLLSFA